MKNSLKKGLIAVVASAFLSGVFAVSAQAHPTNHNSNLTHKGDTGTLAERHAKAAAYHLKKYKALKKKSGNMRYEASRHHKAHHDHKHKAKHLGYHF